MREEGDELVGFALAESGSDRRDAEEELCEVGEGSGSLKREGEEGWKQSSVVDNSETIFVRRERARRSWSYRSWSERRALSERVLKEAGRGGRKQADLCRLVQREKWVRPVPANRRRVRRAERCQQCC